MVNFLKKVLSRCARVFGYEVVKIVHPDDLEPPVPFEFTSLKKHAHETNAIPGMVTADSADVLYSLCRMQELRGDVLEIGAWQGKSTSYLARAVKDSGNGRLFAVDHFKGNAGLETSYRIGTTASVTIEDLFRRNMERLGLNDAVSVMAMPSRDAYAQLKDRSFRFIFVDGDHSEEGVKNDISLFLPCLQPGGIVVFDDFDATFPGLVRAVAEWVKDKKPAVVFGQRNMLICKVVK